MLVKDLLSGTYVVWRTENPDGGCTERPLSQEDLDAINKRLAKQPTSPPVDLLMRMHKACYAELKHHRDDHENGLHDRPRSAMTEHLGWQESECPWLMEPRKVVPGSRQTAECDKRPGETVLPLTERQKRNHMTKGHNHPQPCDGEVR